MGERTFPAGFRFGTSTAAYQIEGAVDEDGRGPSIWDTFCAEPGHIKDGSSGAVACDHFHRYAEDVGLLRELGASSYRLSMAWPRVQPDGVLLEPRGLDFYDRLIDELVGAGIEPMVTLFHWDLPQALEDAGGWMARETALRFADYATLAVDRLGDRVESWAPVNEPNVASVFGYAVGMFAPGRTLMLDFMPAAHHLNLAHGLAVQALRAGGARTVGNANNHAPAVPVGEGDAAAADFFDAVWNRTFADPMLGGAYPNELADRLPPGAEDDLAVIAQPLDFYGLNYYNPMGVRAARGELPFTLADLPGEHPRTDFGWPIVPSGLRTVFDRLRTDHPDLPPIRITENGCSYAVGPDGDGVVDDQPRIDYLDAHLQVVADAIADGIDIEGYYCWSLLDNFEWAEGYTQRFGLVHVDYDTLVRTPKRSFRWYSALVRGAAADPM